MAYGYKIGGGLDFPKKKLRVLWFSPPDVHVPNDGHGLGNGPLPRLVIAEVLVDELSPESQVYMLIADTKISLWVFNISNFAFVGPIYWLGDNKEVFETRRWQASGSF